MHENGSTDGIEVEHSGLQLSGATVDYERLLSIGRDLLLAIGENPDREGLEDTPRRFAKWWKEFIEYDPGATQTTFANFTSGQMVIVKGMKVWSLCEHHLLPFSCDISIGYIVNNKVLGLSKFARVARKFAHRLQIQERLVAQIAEEISAITCSENVAVIGKGEHLCMTIRGVQMPAVMTSLAMRGVFEENSEVRAELIRLIE